MYGAILNAANAAVQRGPFAVSPEGYDTSAPTVVFDGQRFIVAWRDGRSGSADLYGVAVTAGGDLLGSSNFDGTALLLYGRYRSEVVAVQLHSRSLTASP